MSGVPARGVVAGIVAYRPDEDELAGLVAAIAGEATETLVFANSPISDDFEVRLAAAAAPGVLRIERPGANVGLGAAYDAILARAREIGARFALLLDQDSRPEAGSLARLANLHDRLAAAGERPALVGPTPVGAGGRELRRPPAVGGVRTPTEGAHRVTFVISSGSLIDLAAAAEIGPFRADFFIDAIDLEWCFRAGARGFSVWMAEEVRMDHRLGRGVIRLPFGLLLADQPALRLYTFVRNQLAMLRLPHVPLVHKVKTVVALPARCLVYLVHNGASAEVRKALRRGLIDGVRQRLGPPDLA